MKRWLVLTIVGLIADLHGPGVAGGRCHCAAFAERYGTDMPYDLDGDGDVDLRDVGVWMVRASNGFLGVEYYQEVQP